MATFDAAVAVASPPNSVQRVLPERPAGRTVVVGAGKASAQMAAALFEVWDGPLSGVVVTRKGHAAGVRADPIAIRKPHPVPDATS